jgi:hypothetical protein
MDAEIIAIAISEERTILTFDRDYGEVIFRHNHKPEKGVIYLRLDEYEPEQPGRIIEEIMTNKGNRSYTGINCVDKNGLRQRKYYCPTANMVCSSSGISYYQISPRRGSVHLFGLAIQ